MIQYSDIRSIIDNNIASGPSIFDSPITLPLSDALQNFVCISFRLPRRSGKTTLAERLHSETSSLLYTRYGKNSFDLYNEESRFRGRRFYGMKIKFIILDEYNDIHNDLVRFILGTLMVGNLLDKDFRIVSFYT